MNFSITNPLDFAGVNSIQDVFTFIINNLILIILPIAAILYIYAGVLFLNAGRDSGSLKKAKDVLLYTSIGLVVIFIGGGFVDLIKSILNAAGGA